MCVARLFGLRTFSLQFVFWRLLCELPQNSLRALMEMCGSLFSRFIFGTAVAEHHLWIIVFPGECVQTA